MWWSRLTFWCVLVAFILNVLQPGYMQFYDVRKPLVALISGFKIPTGGSTQPQQKPPFPRAVTVSQPTPTPTSNCQAPPKNDYERILFAQGIGGCNASSN